MKLKQQFERLSPNYLTIQPHRPPLTKKKQFTEFLFCSCLYVNILRSKMSISGAVKESYNKQNYVFTCDNYLKNYFRRKNPFIKV